MIIDELSKQGRPLPQVINNATLKNEMQLVNELRQRMRAQAEQDGLNPPATPATEEQKFADPRQTELLTEDSLKIIDELSKQGRPLPQVINNATLKNEMELVNRLRENIR